MIFLYFLSLFSHSNFSTLSLYFLTLFPNSTLLLVSKFIYHSTFSSHLLLTFSLHFLSKLSDWAFPLQIFSLVSLSTLPLNSLSFQFLSVFSFTCYFLSSLSHSTFFWTFLFYFPSHSSFSLYSLIFSLLCFLPSFRFLFILELTNPPIPLYAHSSQNKRMEQQPLPFLPLFY